MGKETERKFLVKDESYKEGAKAYDIAQGYICAEEGRVVRVRVKGERAFITVKSATVGYARDEFEYEIPAEEGRAMLERVCLRPIIEKRRYEKEYGGHKWEVDEFGGENEGLVVAEIELEDEDERFELPPFAGAEVTGNALYYNARLFDYPLSRWSEEERREYDEGRK